MAKQPRGCFYFLLGGWIFDIIKWIFILAFWPISLIVWIVKNRQQKQSHTYTVKVKNYNYGGGDFSKSVAHQTE